jgi:nucleoside-diphosphate-sugar epimerase
VGDREASPAPRRVFITGALGFIGRLVAQRYRDAGAEVVGVDQRADASLGVVAGDLREPGGWQEAASGAELFIHTAALVGMGGDADAYWRANVVGTRHAVDAAARAGAGRFVHISSIVAFGFDFEGNVDERHPVRPNGVPYVDTKVASEQVVLAAHAAGEIACTVVRPGDVYGPGSYFWTATPVREIAARRIVLPARGRGLLSPVYVDDLVDGVLLAASRPEAVGHIYTLTGDRPVETREFFGHYARMLGRKGVPGGPTAVVLPLGAGMARLRRGSEVTPAAIRYFTRRGTYSIEKARSQLGYEPSVGLDEGMRRCEQWLRAEGLLDPG